MHAGRSALCIPKALLMRHLCASPSARHREGVRDRNSHVMPARSSQGCVWGGSYHWGSWAGIGGLLGEEKACLRASGGACALTTPSSLNPDGQLVVSVTESNNYPWLKLVCVAFLHLGTTRVQRNPVIHQGLLYLKVMI